MPDDLARISLRRALEALADAAADRLARHPNAHLLAGDGRRHSIDLALSLPLETRLDDGRRRELLDQWSARLDRELAALLEHHAALRPGHVYCLRCGTADCEHSAPAGPREVFVGYGTTGMPQWADMAQWLLAHHDPRVDRLYAGNGKAPGLVATVLSGRRLTADLLPSFLDGDGPLVRLHGQVTAGWFPLVGGPADERQLGLSLQIISTPLRRKRGRSSPAPRKLALNVVGAGPGGESLEHIEGRAGSAPWTTAVQWGQRVLESIERSQGRMDAAHLSSRIEGVLQAIARRIEQGRRAEDRRTRHAEDRHRGGERPTRMAAADLGRARDDRILKDTLRDTWIVLGERGRAHVFGQDGKLVTSLRESPESIAKKRARGRWRPASSDEIRTLRAMGSGDAPA